MKQLPLSARLYVAAVIAAGGVLLTVGLPLAHFDRPALLAP